MIGSAGDPRSWRDEDIEILRPAARIVAILPKRRSQKGISFRPGFWPEWLDSWRLDLTHGACQVGTGWGVHAKHAGCCPEAAALQSASRNGCFFHHGRVPGWFLHGDHAGARAQEPRAGVDRGLGQESAVL